MATGKTIICALLAGMIVFSSAYALERPDIEFKVFQFPPDMIPTIDGDPSDWDMVPESYANGMTDMIDNVYDCPVDLKDKDCTVKVGWVKGMNQLYFLYESYDDFWRISEKDLINDIFEISIDADLSGETLIKEFHPDVKELGADNLHYTMHGVHAQNYHVFTPPGEKDWAMVWGCAQWLKRLPYANSACKTYFEGNSGRLVLECWITPYDYASPEGPDKSIQSELKEDTIIGLTWGVSDYDSILIAGRPFGNNYDGQFNLSHTRLWFATGSNACAFRLMPLDEPYRPAIKAFAEFEIIDMANRVVAFKDRSEGDITKWTWDFGNGIVSHERNPVHTFDSPGGKTVVLEVEGPAGRSQFPFVYQEIFLVPANE